MIERLNFYDIYGYLIPGSLLIGVVWLPFGIAFRTPPQADIGSAVLALIAAYVAGHILQVVATNVISSKVDGQYPSDKMLDDKDRTFSDNFKSRLFAQIRADFGEVSRKVAFEQCRTALILSKGASYAEQLQGMYVLMRGISGSAAIGCAFTLGWWVRLWNLFGDGCTGRLIVMVLILSAGVLTSWMHRIPRDSPERDLFIAVILLGFAAGGVLSAAYSPRPASLTTILGAVWVLELLSMFWAYGAYQTYATTFAKTVYRDFMVLQKYPPKGD